MAEEVFKDNSHVTNMPTHIYMIYDIGYCMSLVSLVDEISNHLMLRDNARNWASPQPDSVSGPILLKEFLSVEETDSSLTMLTPVRLN